MHSIRKFVGRGTLALGIGAVVALAVAVQSGQAARVNDASQVSSSSAQVAQTPSVHLNFTLVSTSPSPACTTAMGQLQAQVASDMAEDVTERSTNTTDTEAGADATEDTTERAAFKPLIAAIVAACGTTSHVGHKAPIVAKTPACAAALQALKAGFAQARAEQQAEVANGSEATAADQAEDQTEFGHLQSLWGGVKTACWTTRSTTTGTSTFSTWWWHR